MKKHILSTTGFVVAFGLVASPVFAAHAPKAAPVSHHVTKSAPVSHHVTIAAPTVSHGAKAVSKAPKIAKVTPAPKGKGEQKAKPITIPKSHIKDAHKFLEPVVKNVAKVTNFVQSLTKSVSAFNSSDVPTELAFYHGTLDRLTGLSNQLNALTKQVDHIARKYGQTTDVSSAYALIAAAKNSITNEAAAVQALMTSVKTAAPTTTTTTGSNSGTTTGTTDGTTTAPTTTTTGSTTGTTDGTTAGSTNGTTTAPTTTTTGSTTGTTDGTTTGSTNGTSAGSTTDTTTSGTTASTGSTTNTPAQ